MSTDSAKRAYSTFANGVNDSFANISERTAQLFSNLGDNIGKKVKSEFGEVSSQLDETVKLSKKAETSIPERSDVRFEDYRWESSMDDIHEKLVQSNTAIPHDVHTIDEIVQQQAEILRVQSGEASLSSNAIKGNFGEMVQDEYYRQFGYERISEDMVTELTQKGHQGIDGVYHNPNGHPPYVIAEAKFGSSRLGKTKSGKQMSDRWIRERLKNSVSDEFVQKIREAEYLGDVQKHLFNLKHDGRIVLNQLDSRARKLR